MYRHTELYGDVLYANVEKPDNMTPEEFTKELIESTYGKNPKLKREIIKHVKGMMDYHYRKTTDPLLFEFHPVSNLNWREVWKIVLNGGDMKERRMRSMINTEKALNEQKRRYLEEYENEYCKKEGRWAFLKNQERK
jgi:hypothetical protein